jgi:acyl-CoA dehydrogenase
MTTELHDAVGQALGADAPLPARWERLHAGGFTHLGTPESAGGSGGDTADAVAVVAAAAEHGASVPLVESALLGAWALAAAGQRVSAGPYTVALPGTHTFRLTNADSGWTITGSARAVPWARHADAVVVLSGDGLTTLDPALCQVTDGTNLGGEPRDDVTADAVPVPPPVRCPDGVTPAALELRGALGRAAQIAGALRRLERMTVAYATERVQFGRPIARFQAVQQLLARLSEECAAAGAAVDLAGSAGYGEYGIRVAKIRAGAAAGAACAIAHQIHGALGFTAEYALSTVTTRLLSWRDEYGAEAEHARRLGDLIRDRGADRLWAGMVAAT